jgi:ankyrin repeat protein
MLVFLCCRFVAPLYMGSADTNARDRFGASPLDQAAFANHVIIVIYCVVGCD